MKLLLRWATTAVAIGAAAALLPGIEIDGGVSTWFLIALVLTVVNLLLGSVVRLLAFPLILLTLGLFAFVINAAMLLVTDALMDSFDIDGFLTALLAAVVISVITSVADAVFRT